MTNRAFNTLMLGILLGVAWLFLAPEPEAKANRVVNNVAAAGYDSDAEAIIAALDSAGATPSAGEEEAINTFVVTLKADGVWAKTHRLYFPIHGVAAANALDWKNLGSGTFSGSWTHGSGYVQGAASTYFSAGVNANTVFTKASGCYSFHCESSDTDGSKFDCGHFQRGNLYYDGATSLQWDYIQPAQRVTGTISSGDKNGLVVASRVSGTNFIRRRKTAGVTSLASAAKSDAGVDPATSPILFGATNFDVSSGINPVYSTQRLYRQWGIHDGLTTTEADNFSAACYELLTTGYGLTLP